MRQSIAPPRLAMVGLALLALALGGAAPRTLQAADAAASNTIAGTAPVPDVPAILAVRSAETLTSDSLAGAPVAEPAAQQAPLIRIGTASGISDAGVLIGRARGYFRDQGLNVELVPLQSAPEAIPGLASGDLEAAGGTISTALFNAIDRGVGLKMIADKGGSRPGFEYTQLVVRRDLLDSGAIREPADLRGRKVALASLRSGVESLTAQVVKPAGLTTADVDLTSLGYPEQVVALSNNAIDAAVTIEPMLSVGFTQGVSATWQPGWASTAYGGVYQSAVLVISPRVAAQPDEVRRFLVAYLRGVRDYNDAFARGMGRPEMVALLADQTTVKDPAAYDRMQMPSLDPDGRMAKQALQIDLDYFRQVGAYTGPLNIPDVIDESYLDAALREIGPYQ
jgi:NitT/TauT family transport system substrate-binding protein